MILTSSSYAVQCSCAQLHRALVALSVVEAGALHHFETYREQLSLPKTYCAVYDENTYAATEGRRPAATHEVLLRVEGLHADEKGIAQLEEKLPATAMLVAVGSGTLHDITRYCAAKRSLPFVSVPTAGSVDGFASKTSSMTLHGLKVTVPAVAPTLIVADTEVLAKAPWRLTCSGVGDVLGKTIALADWKLGHLLRDEPYCEGIAALTNRALQEVVAAVPMLRQGGLAAYEKLMEALIFSGVAMQLAGSSRPAAGAEHYISHCLELGLGWLPHTEALHGEKVGVGTLLCAEAYHRRAALDAAAIPRHWANYRTLTAAQLKPVFGGLTGEVVAQNADDCLCGITAESLAEHWEEVRAAVAGILPAPALRELMEEMGCKTTLPDIGVDAHLLPELLHWSPYVRNRLTFLRLTEYLLHKSAFLA